ncbi:MAG: LytTR family DNA-binding domain-containing protein [Deltaproteobacteria bacterium]|nr:LytTR family DNA-binding domain-containing protein [Deltaproteobacteria bacterium]
MSVARVLIVDDEVLARRRIRKLLVGREGVEVVAEAASGAAASEAIRESSPDLVFLDVQLPDMNGFAVLRSLDPGAMPAIIFATAYDRYALEAFEVHALDYLLKPFDDERFEEALSRALTRLHLPADKNLRTALRRFLDAESESEQEPRRLVVRSAGRIVFLDLEEIEWVEAQGSYVRLHTAGDSHLLRDSMKALEDRLPGDRYLRIHRSSLVRLDRIKELRNGRDGSCRVLLENGHQLDVSDSRRPELLRRLGVT